MTMRARSWVPLALLGVLVVTLAVLWWYSNQAQWVIVAAVIVASGCWLAVYGLLASPLMETTGWLKRLGRAAGSGTELQRAFWPAKGVPLELVEPVGSGSSTWTSKTLSPCRSRS